MRNKTDPTYSHARKESRTRYQEATSAEARRANTSITLAEWIQHSGNARHLTKVHRATTKQPCSILRESHVSQKHTTYINRKGSAKDVTPRRESTTNLSRKNNFQNPLAGPPPFTWSLAPPRVCRRHHQHQPWQHPQRFPPAEQSRTRTLDREAISGVAMFQSASCCQSCCCCCCCRWGRMTRSPRRKHRRESSENFPQ